MGVDAPNINEINRALNPDIGKKISELYPDMSFAVQRQGAEGPRVVSIEDGTGNARSARVNADNNVGTEARFGRSSVVTGEETVDTSSAICVMARTGRLTLTLQNLDDAIPIHFHLGSGSATTDDLRLDPGQMYSPPPGVTFEGPVSCLTPSGVAKLAFVEYSASS